VGLQNTIGSCRGSVVKVQFSAPEKSRQQRHCVVDCANPEEDVEITVAATSIAILIIDGLPDLVGADHPFPTAPTALASMMLPARLRDRPGGLGNMSIMPSEEVLRTALLLRVMIIPLGGVSNPAWRNPGDDVSAVLKGQRQF